MRKIILTTFALLLFAALASAQVPAAGNIFVGYSFYSASPSSFDLVNGGRPNLNGWEGSLEGKVLPWVGIVADLSGHYGSQTETELTPAGPVTVSVSGHETDVMFGPRLSVSVGKFRPFGEALFGVGHVSTGDFLSTSEHVVCHCPGRRAGLQDHPHPGFARRGRLRADPLLQHKARQLPPVDRRRVPLLAAREK